MTGRNIILRMIETHPLCVGLIVGLIALAGTPVAWATEEGEPSGEDLAKKLANPIASLISVPFQLSALLNPRPLAV